MRIAEEVLFDICRLSCGRNREEKRKWPKMGNRKGLTPLDVLVTIFVVMFMLAILMPACNKPQRISPRVKCGMNFKGLGTAMIVYANDYDDNFPELPGEGPWAKELGFDYNSLSGPRAEAGRTISASWYLLVREADVSPKSFVCPSSSQVGFDGGNPNNLDIIELWDFGADPYKHVSYSMHNPYGKFPADGTRSAAFAVAGDMSPWFLDGDIVAPAAGDKAPQLITIGVSDADDNPTKRVDITVRVANSIHHDQEGQNVLYGDGHNWYENRSDVGVKRDGIYTYQSKGDIRIGTNPTARDEANDARSKEDSFLGI